MLSFRICGVCGAGENGIMKKKFISMKKDIEEQNEELKIMSEKEIQLTHHAQELTSTLSLR